MDDIAEHLGRAACALRRALADVETAREQAARGDAAACAASVSRAARACATARVAVAAARLVVMMAPRR